MSRTRSRSRFALGAALLGALVPVLASSAAEVQPHPGLLRFPDVSQTHIVFVYANDLWIVPRDGGTAVPLASPPGTELFPKFSDDGETIAFVGNYDGNRDLYTVPRRGGVPTRVTHHPSSEVLCGWTPQGELLFFTNGLAGLSRQVQLFTVGAEGGLPTRLPVPYGATASISADGVWLAYTPHTRDHRTWKRYRGGMATDIWLFNLEDRSAQKITEWEGTDSLPMWHGRRVYYLSDAGPEHRLNIWCYDPATRTRRQVTKFDEFDVKWPSIGPGPSGHGEIVFQNGADLLLLDLDSAISRVVEIAIPGARPTIRPKRVDASEYTRWWHISSTGKRAVVEARGDIWTAPAEHGSPRNLTRTSGAAEREPSWSPDGRWVAYFSDADGEYELYITQSDGKGETEKLTSGSATFYYDPVWSPDSEHIAFRDKAGAILLHTIESGETRTVDTNPWGEAPRPSWSHDSRWLAYARGEDSRPMSAIWVYEVETGERSRLTSGVFDDGAPAFDRKGDFLYFSSSREFSPTYSDLDTTFIYNRSRVILAVPLRKDVENPYLPESDEETWDEEEDAEETDEEAEDEAEGEDEAEAEDEADEDEEDEEEEEEDAEEAEPVPDDGFSGTWEGTVSGGPPDMPAMDFVMTLRLAADGTVTGTITVPIGTAEISGTYDEASGELRADVVTEEGETFELVAKVTGTSMSGTVTNPVAGFTMDFSGERTAVLSESDEEAEEEEAREVVEIDVEGFEARAMRLAIERGNFGDLAVNDKNQLIYARFKPGSPPEIMLFDIDDDKKEEKSVAKGAGGFEISGDGKKLIVLRGTQGAQIQNASAGASGKAVVTAGMTVEIDPREEWQQLFVEAWRLQRDFFYVDNLHGVDWPAIREHYAKMLEDCVTREEVGFVISEMIAELNIGHAYYFGGDIEGQPSVSVGQLGVDWELADGAYRIARICEGAPWDVDARNPLRAPGVDVNEGDYLLAVNGIAVDTTKDPWAPFVGFAGRTITITVSAKPVLDEEARDVVVTTLGSERTLRYREWIEEKRAYVDHMTDGQVGYIYVPNSVGTAAGRSPRVSSRCSTARSPTTGRGVTARTGSGRPMPTTVPSACSSTASPARAATCSPGSSSRPSWAS
ncbi:MAG: S41 family peptidase [Planctomycetota bacterium]|jgi:tricorn protease-like protein